MNKKALFLTLLAVVLLSPVVALAALPGNLEGIIEGIKTTVVAIGGTFVFIGFAVAGIMYLTAAGAPEKIGTAKKALIAAAIGTALIVLATSSTALIDIITGLMTT